MQDIYYRPLAAADYNEYIRVRLDCLRIYPDNFGITYDEELNAVSHKLDKAINAADRRNFAFGAFAADAGLIGICGFVSGIHSKTNHRGEIVQLFVYPKFGGEAVGRRLLHLSVEKAFRSSDIDQIILGVVYSNEKAIALYRQLGFAEYGRLENYFKTGDRHFTQLFLVLTRNNFRVSL